MERKPKRGKKPAWTQLPEPKANTSGQNQLQDQQYYPSGQFVERLNLRVFKVTKCSWKSQHNYRTCIYYHGDQDKRRDQSSIAYEPEMCERISRNQECPQGESCTWSHSMVEKAYHPEKYRKKFCSYFPNDTQNCPYGKFCSYAHSEEEIQTELLHHLTRDDDFFLFHFKTTFCPYSSEHDRSVCVYAHNWQDYRRSPVKFNYSPNPCPRWDRSKKIVHYEHACTKGFECPDSHGWKEIDFHPARFRKTQCKERNCRFRDSSCPHYHKEFSDSVSPNPQPGFEVFPSNRSSRGAMQSYLPANSASSPNWSKFDHTYHFDVNRRPIAHSGSFPHMPNLDEHYQQQQYYHPMSTGVSLQEFGFPRYNPEVESFSEVSSSMRSQPKLTPANNMGREAALGAQAAQNLTHQLTAEDEADKLQTQVIGQKAWEEDENSFPDVMDSGQADPGSQFYTQNHLSAGETPEQLIAMQNPTEQFMPQFYMVNTANGATVPSHASEHNTFNTEANRQSLINSWKNNFKSLSSPLPQVFPGEGLANDLLGIPAHIHIKKLDNKAREGKGDLSSELDDCLNVGMMSNPLDYLKLQLALEMSNMQREGAAERLAQDDADASTPKSSKPSGG